VVTGGGGHGRDIHLASPVKVGKGREKRYGMLLAVGDRLQLVTGRGVEWDIDRRELTDAKAADSMPRITFTVRGEQQRLGLVAGRPGHDGSGLVAGMKGQPNYAQQAPAVPRWNDWLRPRTPEQLAETERVQQAAARRQRFLSEERADAGALQGPAWNLANGDVCQLRLTGEALEITSSDGSVLHLGRASLSAASWSGSGRKSVLQLRDASRYLSFAFVPPRVEGGGSGVSDVEAVAFVVALPLLAIFSFSDRRAEKQRVRRWRAALPGETPRR
jgi:hypothetical protein